MVFYSSFTCVDSKNRFAASFSDAIPKSPSLSLTNRSQNVFISISIPNPIIVIKKHFTYLLTRLRSIIELITQSFISILRLLHQLITNLQPLARIELEENSYLIIDWMKQRNQWIDCTINQ